MPNSFTTLGFTKPEVGADTDAWGGHLNTDLDQIDGLIQRFVGTTTTHVMKFDMTGVTTTTARIITMIDADLTIVGAANTQTLTNKTLTDANVNTQTPGNNTTKAASTAYVDAAVAANWHVIASNSLAGVTTCNFIGIATTINHLQLSASFNLSVTDSVEIQFYDSGGSLDAGSVYYSQGIVVDGSTPAGFESGVLTGMGLGTFNGSTPVSLNMWINNIQRAARTTCNFSISGTDTNNTNGEFVTGGGGRTANGPITGVRILALGGATLTGRATLYGGG